MWMVIVPVLLAALSKLIDWLMSLDRPLSDKEAKKLNTVIARMRRCETLAVRRGCKAGGEDTEGT
jgi:hypothetical protein